MTTPPTHKRQTLGLVIAFWMIGAAMFGGAGAVWWCFFSSDLTAGPKRTPAERQALDAERRRVRLRIERGERIFNNECVQCHEPYPIEWYDRQEWAWIIEQKAYEADLTDDQRQAVRMYIYAQLKESP